MNPSLRKREVARPDSKSVRSRESPYRGSSQCYSIPRKPVPSQPPYPTSPAVHEELPHSQQLCDYAPYNDSGRLSSSANDTQHDAATYRLSTLPTLAATEPGRAQEDATYVDRQEDSLLPSSSALADNASSAPSKLNWAPYTLRWPFLLSLILISLGLSTTVGILTWYSTTHSGLSNNTGSSVLLFGWRFTPTLVAVLYVLLETMLLVDVRRTEAFARLARNSASSSSSTVLLPASSWWNDPREALRKQKDGDWKGWALFWSSIANILGMLVISPLSAGLLSTEDMQVAIPTGFSRIAAFRQTPLLASATDATFLRSIASSTLGLKTSAWLSDEYAILPFWPSHFDGIPFGSMLAPSAQSWRGHTSIFQVVLDCKSMWLSEAGYQPAKTIQPAPYQPQPSTDVEAYESIQLSSTDGCIYEFAMSANEYGGGFFDIGGGWWSKTFNSSYLTGLSESPTIVVANSSQCGDREVFFVTNPYRNSSTRATGQVCSSTYYQADLETTVTISASQTSVSFDAQEFRDKRGPMSESFSIDDFESLFLGSRWTTKFQPPYSSAVLPMIGGPLLPIAALFNWDIEAMISNMTSNTSMVNEANAVKQRFLGEALQNTFMSIGAENAASISGQTLLLESRVVVNFAVGITLGVLLLCSALMFTTVLIFSRPHRRPLGLARDPASAAAITALVARNDTRYCFKGADRLSKERMHTNLNSTLFRLRAEALSVVGTPATNNIQANSPNQKAKSDWRPAVLHGWSGISALIFISLLVGGIIALFVESRKSALYQTIFVYQKTFSVGKGVTVDIAPYSIIPTLLAIILRLWWGAIESTFKRLQPYVSMTRRTTKASEGLVLSYVDSGMLWASMKAVKNRHWLLALITLGTFFTEIFTVSMSALWGRESGTMVEKMSIPRQFELRTVPAVYIAQTPITRAQGNSIVENILAQIYGTVLQGWLYGGLVDLVYNGSRPSWTSEDHWAFAPVDLSQISLPEVQTTGSNTSEAYTSATANATLSTPGMRARIECTALDLRNTSSWLMTLDFRNHSNWNQSTVPTTLDTGYSLSATMDGYMPLGIGRYQDVWNQWVTTFSVDDSKIICCANETKGSLGNAAIGYWSMNEGYGDAATTNFTIKWIVGKLYGQQALPLFVQGSPYEYFGPFTVWEDIPQMTALNCMPVFETADAEVTVDISSSTVQNYTLTTSPANSTAAWSDAWLSHTNTSYTDLNANITVSYGWLFTEALVSAADTSGIGRSTDPGTEFDENLNDRTFNFRQPGLNLDFMSYSALALLNNDIEALLSAETLFKVSNRIFSTFFQHFVAANVTAKDGSYGFQPLDAALPAGLGPILNESDGGHLSAYQDQNDTHHLSSTVEATLSINIEQLHMSPTAVYLCITILAFLAATTIWVYTRHRNYFKALPRDVDTLASVLGFVYASPKLLDWVEKHKHEKNWGLNKTGKNEVMASMGWFDGGSHWGIELSDEGEGLGMLATVSREKEKHKTSNSSSGETGQISETEALTTAMSPRATR